MDCSLEGVRRQAVRISVASLFFYAREGKQQGDARAARSGDSGL